MSKPVINLILIENSQEDSARLIKFLESSEDIHFQITHLHLLREFEAYPDQTHFEIMLLDLNLPDTRGIETVTVAHIKAPELPIIVLSSEEEESLALNVVQAGAQDYLIKKDLDAHALIRTIRYAMERNRLMVALGELNRRQQFLATHDLLTHLPNRQLLQDRLEQALVHSQRYKQLFAVMFIDLDSFKTINDSLGHDYGDQLLKMVAERLTHCIRTTDTLARLGGDEFIVVLTHLNDLESINRVAENILQIYTQPFMLKEHEVYVTASIGIAIYPHDGNEIKTLLKNADAAMYSAKALGRNNYAFYTPELQISSYQKLTLINNLRRALEGNEFMIYYQPQIDTQTNKLIGLEALLRWHHYRLGFIEPQNFINVAEEAGLIVPIGAWVLKTACEHYLVWQEEGIAPPFLAVNLSVRQFSQPGFVSTIKKILDEANFDPCHLDLELTESIIMNDPEEVILELHALKKLGIHISIDDFGTGYSSLSYLKNLPIDTLKIDKSFVTGLAEDESNTKIIQAIIALAHSLGIDVLAEGVETIEEKNLLIARGCTRMQGYLFHYPMSMEETGDFLRKPQKVKKTLITQKKT